MHSVFLLHPPLFTPSAFTWHYFVFLLQCLLCSSLCAMWFSPLLSNLPLTGFCQLFHPTIIRFWLMGNLLGFSLFNIAGFFTLKHSVLRRPLWLSLWIKLSDSCSRLFSESVLRWSLLLQTLKDQCGYFVIIFIFVEVEMQPAGDGEFLALQLAEDACQRACLRKVNYR